MTPERIPYYYGLQFRGFGLCIINLDKGTIVPQYLQLFPMWTAIFYSIFGLKGFLYVNPLFGVLSILGIYFIGKNLFDRKTGAICAALLSINFIQIWFSRYPGAEMLFQLLFFSGIVALILFEKSSHRFFGLLSGVCFGLLFFTRIDSLLLLLPVSAYFVYLTLSGRFKRNYLYVFIPFVVLFAHSIVYYLFTAFPYVHGQFIGLISAMFLTFPQFFERLFIIIPTLLAILGVTILYLCRGSSKVKRYIKHGIVFFSIAALVMAYLTYPLMPPGIGGSNLIMLGWYLTDFGVVLGVLGLIFMVYEKSPSRILFLLFISIFVLLYLIHIQNQVIQPWCMRRYIDVVIPALFIGIGYIIFMVRNKISPRVIYVAVVLLCVISIGISGLVIGHVENKGMVGQISNIADHFDDDSIIIFSQPVLRGVSFPLKYIYDRNAILLPTEPKAIDDVNKFVDMCTIWFNEDRDVYLVNPSQGFCNSLSASLETTPYLNYTLETTLLKHTEARSTIMGPRYDPEDRMVEPPREIERITDTLKVYRLRTP